MPHPYWPLFDLRVRTPRLEIRYPTDDDLCRLTAVIDEGIHDPDTMPFLIPWTDEPPPQRQRGSFQWWWSKRAQWRPEDWTFAGAVFVDGEPVGAQDLLAKNFGPLRTVRTGSWLGRPWQGRGLGKEMRAAILHLAFEGLGATEANSEAFHDNAASLGTSRSLGYEDNGLETVLRRGTPDRMVRLRLTRADWLRRRRDDIAIDGLEACRDQFGLPGALGEP